MNVEKRINYLVQLFVDIRGGAVENYGLACSEFRTWCSILRSKAVLDERGKIAKLESAFDSYQLNFNANLRLLRELKLRLT